VLLLLLDNRYRTPEGFLKLLRKDWFGEGFAWKISPADSPELTVVTTSPKNPTSAARNRGWSLAPRGSMTHGKKTPSAGPIAPGGATSPEDSKTGDKSQKKKFSGYGTCGWPGLLLLCHCVDALVDLYPDYFLFSKSFLTTLLGVFSSVNVIFFFSGAFFHLFWC
jgi:hypothetical protein